MESLIKDCVGLAFVHGCQFTAVPRLFHQVQQYVQILTTSLILKSHALYPVGTSVEEGRNEGLNFDLCPGTVDLLSSA